MGRKPLGIRDHIREDLDMTHADLRALAARIETEEPTEELRNLILTAVGSEAEPANAPNPLTSIDDAAALMPAGWVIWMIDQKSDAWSCEAERENLDYDDRPHVESDAPTEPRARTAGALRAMAVEMERT